ncbi:NRAMP family [Dillenia turbinata]|uniref:NRAMP family n=1 Tax=Dillenia turbinata TaxID=194707 RepID=A0AAN8VQJ9_9MAGN
MSSISMRLPSIFGPLILISLGYIDPGKWAAIIEGGSHSGRDFAFFTLVLNFAAILCHYLVARIVVVTGRNLAQICGQEYDRSTCIFLGVLAEISIIVLELTRNLGIARGLNLLFGLDLFTCLILTAIDAILFPLLSTLLANLKVEYILKEGAVAGLLLIFYGAGIIVCQPGIPLTMNEVATSFRGETMFSLMSLLGATIMPHNFYLHSFLAQQHSKAQNMSKDALCQDHLLAILCLFSAIFLANHLMMNQASSVLNSSGIVAFSLQDGLFLMDQVFRSLIANSMFFLVLLFSREITMLSWNLAGQAVFHELFKVESPVWLHRAIIKMLASVLALYCVKSSGAEGIYQLLIFVQVILATLLPSSLIPLFRVATSRSIMGAYKISHCLEFLTLAAFIAMLSLKVVFVVDVLFGNSEWMSDLSWKMRSGISLSTFSVITAFASFCSMLYIIVTPLKSSNSESAAEVLNWDLQKSSLNPCLVRDEMVRGETLFQIKSSEAQEIYANSLLNLQSGSTVDCNTGLPNLVSENNRGHSSNSSAETSCTLVSAAAPCLPKESRVKSEFVPLSNENEEIYAGRSKVICEVSDGKLPDADNLQKVEPIDIVKEIEIGELQTKMKEDGGCMRNSEGSSKELGVVPSTASKALVSLRRFSGKGDEGGKGGGSLSRFPGLGRAGRRQLASILDEFWGQLYDFHGQVTQEAKSKKLDVLLGIGPKLATQSPRLGNCRAAPCGCFKCMVEKGSVHSINSTKQHKMSSNIMSSYRPQYLTPFSWSSPVQLSDAYAPNSNHETLWSNVHGEKRYSSLCVPQSSNGLDDQPATVHGYQLASYLSKFSTANLDQFSSSLPAPKISSFKPTGHWDLLDHAPQAEPQSHGGSIRSFDMLTPMQTNSLHDENIYYDRFSSAGQNLDPMFYPKKYHSLPNVSGLAIPSRYSYSYEKGVPVGTPGSSEASILAYENALSMIGSSASEEIFPSVGYSGSLFEGLHPILDIGSVGSKQQVKQLLRMTGEAYHVGDGWGRKLDFVMPDSTGVLDVETELLQSFQYCIIKLKNLEGSDWLFRRNDGADEDLIERVAAQERLSYDAGNSKMNHEIIMAEHQAMSSDKKANLVLTNDDRSLASFKIPQVPHCGEGCIWQVDLVISFGVWCIHRILELSLMESRPELWGKYTYVLNRLQGILDLAFLRSWSPLSPCLCIGDSTEKMKSSSLAASNGNLLTAGKAIRSKLTTASRLLDMIKDVEIAMSNRKGRSGTAAGDVAFPKGKENLASVLQRYKRRLVNREVKTSEGEFVSRKVLVPSSYIL